MAVFGSRNNHNHHDDVYSPVDADEEGKPLQRHHENVDSDPEINEIAQREIYALSRQLRRAQLFLKIIIGLLIIIIIAVMSMNVPESVRKILKSTNCSTGPRLLKTPVPPITTEKVSFEKHHIYSQRPNEESDQAWNDLLPEGRGFVYINDYKKYDLPPGQNTTWGMLYSVAVFHQMHCLGQLRRFSWMFLDAIVKNDTAAQEEIKGMFGKLDHESHLNHCFDYLRQTIQCGGDMAMEWPRTEPNGQRFAVDGWGIPHECKNWGQITDYMAEHHFEHSTVSEIAPLVGSSG